MKCLWVITKDHFYDADDNLGGDRRGMGNLRHVKALVGADREQKAQWGEANLPFQFRLYDDDGELYYEGRCNDRESEKAFFPLDWASFDSGCTRIDYLQDNGKWETL